MPRTSAPAGGAADRPRGGDGSRGDPPELDASSAGEGAYGEWALATRGELGTEESAGWACREPPPGLGMTSGAPGCWINLGVAGLSDGATSSGAELEIRAAGLDGKPEAPDHGRSWKAGPFSRLATVQRRPRRGAAVPTLRR
eukprot:gene16264-biopygen9745